MTNITLSQLLGASVEGIRTVGQYFEDTREDYDTAERQFDTGVANPIRSDHSWKGEGVSNATMVAETNASALAAAKIVNEAAWLALDGLAAAVQHTQSSMRKTLADADKYHVVVHDDGSVSPSHYYDSLIHQTPTSPPPPEGMGEEYQGSIVAAERITREVKGYLAFVTIADRSCSGMLGKLSYLSPTTTDTADPEELAHNRGVLAGAMATRNLAVLTRDFWDTVTPKAIPKGADASKLGKIALDVIGVSGAAAGVISSLGEDATGVGAVLGGVQGVASAGALVSGFQQLAKDAKGKSNDDSYKPVPPEKGNDLLNDAYLYGNVPAKDLDQGGQGYTPESPSTPGEPPKYDNDGNVIPYKEFTDVGPRKNSNEVLVVDEKSGHTYYSDDNGKSFLQVA